MPEPVLQPAPVSTNSLGMTIDELAEALLRVIEDVLCSIVLASPMLPRTKTLKAKHQRSSSDWLGIGGVHERPTGTSRCR